MYIHVHHDFNKKKVQTINNCFALDLEKGLYHTCTCKCRRHMYMKVHVYTLFNIMPLFFD